MITVIDRSGLTEYTRKFNKEVSGLAGVTVVTPSLLFIDKFYKLCDVSEPSFTEITAETLHKFFLEKIKVGEDVSNIRCWWHTHGKFSAFFSAKDLATIENFPAGTDWLLSVVFGSNNSVKARVDMFKPLRIETSVAVSGNFAEDSRYNIYNGYSEKFFLRKVNALALPYSLNLRK